MTTPLSTATPELGVERAFRDARAATVMAPTSDTLYDLFGRSVLGLPAF